MNNIKINDSDRLKRYHFPCSNTNLDYMDFDIRRIFTQNGKHEFENQIFEEKIGICLTENATKISIKNCNFKQGFFIRNVEEHDFDYSIYIYKSDITNDASIAKFESKSDISIDCCMIDNLYISGKRGKIDFYGSEVGILDMEYTNFELFRVELTNISKYSLLSFNPTAVFFDTDNLAISDSSRFLPKSNQTLKQVSEIYHRAVIKSANSIKSATEINYQLTRATSDWKSIPFGYFYKPFTIVLWMSSIIIVFSILYWLTLGVDYENALYFSVYTFLTIGFGDLGNSNLMLKTLFVFIEGLLGIVYVSALLISIMNSSRK